MYWIYAGSRTTRERNARGCGLTVYAVDEHCARWQAVQTIKLVNPSYLVANTAATRLYTVHGDQSEVTALEIRADGRLQALGTRSTHGRNPVHLALTWGGRHLLVANYATGTLCTLPIQEDGDLGEAAALLQLPHEPGPNAHQQKGAHPHQVLAVPGTGFFLVPDKGCDRVHLVEVAPTGAIQYRGDLRARAGSGPRHGVFGAPGRAWVVNELDSTLACLTVDVRARCLQELCVASLLPGAYQGTNQASGIALHRRHGTLYVGNRGHDSVSVMQLEGECRVTLRQNVPTLGSTPRFLTLTQSGEHLLVANETSDCWARFPILDDGRLGEPSIVARAGSPVCAAIVPARPFT